MKKGLFPLLLASTCLLTCALFYVAYLNDAVDQHSLSFLTPVVEAANSVGRTLMDNVHTYLVLAAQVSVGVVLLLAIRRRDYGHTLFFLALAIALLTQFILIDGGTRRVICSYLKLSDSPVTSRAVAAYVGVAGYTLTLVLTLLAFRSPTAPSFESVRNLSKTIGWRDFVILLGIISVGAFLRIYGLNHLPNSFEGELAPYSAGGTSLKGMFYANRGHNGPWAPLGILYYLPIYATTSVFGVSLLSLRMSSALVGIATIPLVFLLAHKIAGRAAGLFASALFALNCLHIGWSRTDIHPHGVTTWPSLLMCFFLIKAAETKKFGWSLAVALMMGISWHQYPSGQSAVAIPLIAVGFSFFWNGGALPLRWFQLFALTLGVGLWVLGLPLSYYPVDGHMRFSNPFTLTGPRALWSTEGTESDSLQAAGFVIVKTLTHLWHFIQGIFFKVPYLFHQERLPYHPELPSRSVPCFVVALSMVALGIMFRYRKRFETAVLFGWFVAAVLPGILSEHAYPKRLSTVFPLFDVVGGITLAFIFGYLKECRFAISRYAAGALAVGSLVILTISNSYFWFAGTQFRYGIAPEVPMVQELERTIQPNTIIVAGFGGGYEPGKFLYLLLNHVTAPENRPNLYLFLSNPQLANFTSSMVIHEEWVRQSLPYLWSKMDKQADETFNVKEWQTVTFIIIDNYHGKPCNEEAVARAMASCPNPSVVRVGSRLNTPSFTQMSIVSITCKISEMPSPPTIKLSPHRHAESVAQ